MSIVVTTPASTQSLITRAVLKQRLGYIELSGLTCSITNNADNTALLVREDAGGDWFNDGVQAGKRVKLSGFVNAGNNESFNIEAILSGKQLTLTDTEASTVNEVSVADIGMSETSNDAFFDDIIAEASDVVTNFVGRPLGKESVTERLVGTDRFRLVLTRTPVVTVTEVRFDGDVVDASEYALEDAERGWLFRQTSWPRTGRLTSGLFPGGITRHGLPEKGEEIWEVDYDGGYWLPTFAGSPGGSDVLLPTDVLQATHELLRSGFHTRDRDPGLLFWSAEGLQMKFQDPTEQEIIRGIPATITDRLRPYQRIHTSA